MMAVPNLPAPSDAPSPVERLLAACPFLAEHRDEYWDCGETIVFGHVARLLMKGKLDAGQAGSVFAFFNRLAEEGDEQAVTVLATGAIELFNDDAESQRLARTHLRGAALRILEDMRIAWGQPDYGSGAGA
jgi:hypothetical protein